MVVEDVVPILTHSESTFEYVLVMGTWLVDREEGPRADNPVATPAAHTLSLYRTNRVSDLAPSLSLYSFVLSSLPESLAVDDGDGDDGGVVGSVVVRAGSMRPPVTFVAVLESRIEIVVDCCDGVDGDGGS